MLNMRKWRKRLLKAWHAKVRNAQHGPNEVTTRWQDGCRVSLLLWEHKHSWIIVYKKKVFSVRIDTPISQEAVFRWLEKTKPIE